MALIDINWRPDRRGLRIFGAALAAVLALVAVVFVMGRSPAAAYALLGLAALAAVLAAAAPAALRPAYVGLSVVGWPLGWVLSYVVLALVYFGVITPIGLVMRLVGRDPLHRKFDPVARTYWVDRRAPADVKRYFRQF